MKYNGEQAETNKSKANLFAKFSATVYIESSLLSQWRKSKLVAYWSKYNLMEKKFSFYSKTQRQIKAEDQMVSHLFSLRKHVYLSQILYHKFSEKSLKRVSCQQSGRQPQLCPSSKKGTSRKCQITDQFLSWLLPESCSKPLYSNDFMTLTLPTSVNCNLVSDRTVQPSYNWKLSSKKSIKELGQAMELM